ncbi:amidase [Microvirga alba]|uniref:Amidase n=1 Tax=Microvirga alba TaxID=2791025 RepID=A0A931BVI6_9HYPH|nr:amidase [Microvirga alba]MBF9235484.1 amidase [Microvirga alba]
MDDALWKLPATQLQTAYRSGKFRPSDVLSAVLERSSKVDPVLNVFATLDEEGARRSAAESDKRFARQEPAGPLDGIPITVKDNIPVKGLRCAWGSKLFLDQISQTDELPVARVRQEGAIILGKTNVSEFTLGRGNVHTLAFGTTRNPWNPALTSGASTGGGAAAVASGIGPIAYGTDGGGSIRRPASHNGLVGLKPSTGRVARRDGLPVILHDFEIVGPLARTVDDLAMALTAIEGPDPLDRMSYGFKPGALERGAKNLRILYVPRLGDIPVEAPIAESCAEAARKLAKLGFDVEEGAAPFDVALFEKHWPVVGSTGLAWLLRDTPWEGRVGEPYPPMIEKGKSLSAIDYVDALAAFRQVYAQLAQNFERYDLVMTPSAGAVPWKAEEYGPPYHRVFTGFVNAAGLPGISIPCDPTPDGLPVGFQLIAPFGADWSLLSVAKDYEEAYPWADRWPSL